jgi:class 3 adenylate cyclase/tetratricopeptide (TPR) repeat protein
MIVAADVEGEQRRVSVMAADIFASTELVEDLDPEEAAKLLDPLIGMMTEAAGRYGGSVNPRGDGILTMFGVAGSAEDNTLRACLTALEILSHLHRQGPHVRIGIHHGEVALLPRRRDPARENFFGPAIHVAARLEQTAEVDTVCLSSEAYELVRDFVEVEPLPPVRVKGISHPLERFRLVRVYTASRWLARLGRGLTPMIDRETERMALAEFLQRLTAPGAHLCQVLGPAGIGKSRLVHEVMQTTAARACCLIPLPGPLHRNQNGYDPLARWLREMVAEAKRLGNLDPSPDLLEEIPGAEFLSRVDRDQLSRYANLSETVISNLQEIDRVEPLSVIEPIATLIVAIARERVVILSCDDAETLDKRQIKHIATLSAAIANRGLSTGVLISSRHALRFSPNAFKSRMNLRLSPLGADHARQLLVQAHPNSRPRPQLVETILTKAGGSPLFIEEVAALLLSHSEQADTDDFDNTIPDRIEPLINDRLARIPRQPRTLLRMCSVLGNTFSPSLLSSVSGWSDGAIQEHLTRLKAERLLYDVSTAVTPRIRFGHLLVRDVAYRTLLPSIRRGIHEKVLRWLEQTDVLSDPSELAHHAVQARLWPEACRYLPLAAIAAAEGGGYSTAEKHLRRALKIAEGLPQDREIRNATVDILIGLRSLLAVRLRPDEADQLLDRAQAISVDLEPEKRLSIQIKRIRALNTRGRLREAMSVAISTERAAGGEGLTGLRLAAMHFMGQACFYTGRFDVGDTTLTQASHLLKEAADRSDGLVGSIPILVFATRAGIRALRGRFEDAERDIVQARSLAGSHEGIYDNCFIYIVSGLVDLQRRDLETAESKFRAGLEIAERHDLRALLPWLHGGVGYAQLLLGSTNAGIAALTEAYQIAGAYGRVLGRMWAATGLAAAYGSSGGTIPALRHADEAVQLGARHSLRGFMVSALRNRGAILATDDISREAGLRSIYQALALARKLDMRPDVAHCLATIAAISGCATIASDAMAAYDALGMGAWARRIMSPETTTPPLNIIAA